MYISILALDRLGVYFDYKFYTIFFIVDIFEALSDVTCCINRNVLYNFLFDVIQVRNTIN